MHKTYTRTFAAVFIVALFFSASCRKATQVDPPPDPHRTAARAIDGIAGNVHELLLLVPELFRAGTLSRSEAVSLNESLHRLDTVNEAARVALVELSEDEEMNLSGYLAAIRLSVDEFDAEVLNIRNQQSRDRFQAIMLAIKSSLLLLEGAVEGGDK